MTSRAPLSFNEVHAYMGRGQGSSLIFNEPGLFSVHHLIEIVLEGMPLQLNFERFTDFQNPYHINNIVKLDLRGRTVV